MRLSVELYVDSSDFGSVTPNYERVDFFDFETIELDSSIQNVKDISKVFTDFSQQFTIPASSKNNRIFKHYYNPLLDNGFDGRRKVKSKININGIEYKLGKIRLDGVDLKKNQPYAYRITFFGELVNLKDLIGEDELSDLEWLDNFGIDYSSSLLKAGLQNGDPFNIPKLVDGVNYYNWIKTPLISSIDRPYYDSGIDGHEVDGNLHYHSGVGHNHGIYWKHLKYSINVPLIIKAIEEKYNISFSNDFFNASNLDYSQLYMWLHRQKGNVKFNYSTGVDTFTSYVDNMQTGVINSNNYTLNGQTYPLLVTGTTSSAVVTGFPTNQPPVGFDRAYAYDITLRPDDTSISYNAYLYWTNSSGTVNNTQVLKGVTGQQTMTNIGGVLSSTNLTWTLRIESTETLTFSDDISGGLAGITWKFPIYTIDGSTLISNDSVKYNSADWQVTETFEFVPTRQIPEMKVIDFLTGLWRMFNLTAYYDGETIKVQSLDDFYSDFNEYDITRYLDTESSSINSSLPFKQVDLEFSEPKTFLASRFNQLQNREFAKEEYTGEDEDYWVGKDYSYSVPFEKVIYERLTDDNNLSQKNIMVGWFADDNRDSTIGKPLLHYINSQALTPDSISFRTTSIDHVEITSSINMPCNQVDMTDDDTNSLNFKAEYNEWTLYENENSLFKNHHEEYLKSVFDKKNRLTIVKAVLPLRILESIKLSDRIIINSKRFKINKLRVDLTTGQSDLELLTDL